MHIPSALSYMVFDQPSARVETFAFVIRMKHILWFLSSNSYRLPMTKRSCDVAKSALSHRLLSKEMFSFNYNAHKIYHSTKYLC